MDNKVILHGHISTLPPPLWCNKQKGKPCLPGSTVNAHSPFIETMEHLPGALMSKQSLIHDLKTVAGYIF